MNRNEITLKSGLEGNHPEGSPTIPTFWIWEVGCHVKS